MAITSTVLIVMTLCPLSLQVGDLLRSFSLLVFKPDKNEELGLVSLLHSVCFDWLFVVLDLHGY